MTNPPTATDPIAAAATAPAELPIRPLCFLDEQEIELAYPPPTPPMVKDPAKGSNAPEVPDYRDPVYVRQYSAWASRAGLLRFAVAAGIALDGLSWPEALTDGSAGHWCVGMVRSLGTAVTRDWVEAAADALETVSLPELVADAAKNSSAP